MTVQKYFAALALSLTELWASRFAPYSCDRLGEIPGGTTWPALLGSGLLLMVFLFLLAYDLVSYPDIPRGAGAKLRTPGNASGGL
ncbi:MAG TPA: hypothetical protein VNJ49_16910 [Bradyrhizobium sp.]|nr:hypothetical protein [Bradyrhizobium sp.]